MTQVRQAHWCVLMAAVAPIVALGATARLDDYARGLIVEPDASGPMVQLDMPDAVYRTVVSNDLSDVRVFNADGVPVPHALCIAPSSIPPTIAEQVLPVYRLQDLARSASDGTRVEVQTPAGAQISVEGTSNDGAERQTSAYVIDARDVNDELRALQFDWSSPDGASEVRVSIQASDDLDRWHTLVATTSLVQLESGGQQLRRHRVAIPQASYEYLRVERVERGPPLQLDGVTAERVAPSAELEPTWFGATGTSTAEPNAYQFDAGRRAPIEYARLVPAQENTSMPVAIDSRADEKAPWTQRWSGEVYSILTAAERRVSPPAAFAPTTDRQWRVRLTAQGESFYQAPMLELGYRPARLRFLAQGMGPYTLAFGSRRAESTQMRSCDSLLGNLSESELKENIAMGMTGAERSLGGDDALRPLPKKTPLRQIVLWGVLVIGVGALVAMALSLLRRIKPDGTT